MRTREELLMQKLEELHSFYDENEGLIGEIHSKSLVGYHSRRTGLVHGTNKSAEYAAAIFHTGQKEYYNRAERVFIRLAELQDTDPESDTFGLWSYYAEEDLRNMEAPDYNFSDFIGKHFIEALEERGDEISPETADIMRTALRNAMACSIKRNVSPDYSNISMMSSMTIISAGELLNDESLKAAGKARLKKAYEYNKYSGAFSEYNSSTYTPLAIAELTRMIMFFKDAECRRMAEELHDLAWENISNYYSVKIGELAPPQKRCYHDLDDGQLCAFIYLATDGRYGELRTTDALILSYLMLPVKCPEKFFCNFEKTGARFIKKRYYKRNNMRTPDEDTVIIRSLDSPDLYASTYITDTFAIGAFNKSDLWNQRRTCSAVWNCGGIHRGFRLRCIKGDYDFCSGVVSADMSGGVVLACVGFVNDHGDYHYILDKTKDAVITTNYLGFVFELCGDTDGVEISEKDGIYVISDDTVEISVSIKEWVFDGEKANIRFNKERKVIELIAYEGEEKTIDLNTVGPSYGAFAMSVNEKCPQIKTEDKGNTYTVFDDERELSVSIAKTVGSFDGFMSDEMED